MSTAKSDLAAIWIRRNAALEAGDIATFESLAADATALTEEIDRDVRRTTKPAGRMMRTPPRHAVDIARSWKRA